MILAFALLNFKASLISMQAQVALQFPMFKKKVACSTKLTLFGV